MARKLSSRLASHLLRTTTTLLEPSLHHHHHYHHQTLTFTLTKSPPLISSILESHPSISALQFFSTSWRQPIKSNRVDIGARARQMQKHRLWTYALTFNYIAGFIVIVLNNFQDQVVFYVTPTDALKKYNSNPTKSKFRLGGLVLEGSVAQPLSSAEMEFVITDLIHRHLGPVPGVAAGLLLGGSLGGGGRVCEINSGGDQEADVGSMYVSSN